MPTRRARRISIVVMAALAATGCAKPVEGPGYLAIDAGGYDEAFDAALEASRRAGLSPVVRDRRAGVIVTDPRLVASFLEPWHAIDQTFSATSSGTTTMERRRARFEFGPVGFAPSLADRDDELPGPDIMGTIPPAYDLSAIEGPLEMRVWVFVEHAHRPGVRRSTWSRRLTTRTEIIEDGEAVPQVFWTTTARDPTAEQRLIELMEAVEMDRIVQPAPAPDGE